MNIWNIRHNYSIPYKVSISDKVNVYKSDDLISPFITLDYTKVFIGESFLNNMTEFSGRHGDYFKGNTILVEIKSNEYVFVGSKIIYFTTIYPIELYYSPIGNNDVPYPYAIDSVGNIYLLPEKVILLKNNRIDESVLNDPYSYYYKHYNITEELGIIPSSPPTIPFFKDIKKWYVNREQYTMIYVPEPIEHNNMFIINTSNRKVDLSFEEYKNILNEYGKLMYFQKLDITNIIE